MIYSDEKGDQLQGKEKRRMGSAGLKPGVHRRGWRSAECKRRVTNWSCRAPTVIEECPNLWRSAERGGGVRSAEWNGGVPFQGEEHQWGMKCALPTEEHRSGGRGGRGGGTECCMLHRSDNPDLGTSAGIQYRLSQTVQCGNEGIKRQMT